MDVLGAAMLMIWGWPPGWEPSTLTAWELTVMGERCLMRGAAMRTVVGVPPTCCRLEAADTGRI